MIPRTPRPVRLEGDDLEAVGGLARRRPVQIEGEGVEPDARERQLPRGDPEDPLLPADLDRLELRFEPAQVGEEFGGAGGGRAAGADGRGDAVEGAGDAVPVGECPVAAVEVAHRDGRAGRADEAVAQADGFAVDAQIGFGMPNDGERRLADGIAAQAFLPDSSAISTIAVSLLHTGRSRMPALSPVVTSRPANRSDRCSGA